MHLVLVHNPIPTHHLPGRSRIPTRVEHILPAGTHVKNSVHRHDFHELFFISTGTGQHMIDLEQHAVLAPCVHLVAPGQVHQLDRSADMHGMVVMFATDAQLGQGHVARTELFSRADRPCAFAMDHARMNEACALVRLMGTELARQEGPMADVVEAYLVW